MRWALLGGQVALEPVSQGWGLHREGILSGRSLSRPSRGWACVLQAAATEAWLVMGVGGWGLEAQPRRTERRSAGQGAGRPLWQSWL